MQAITKIKPKENAGWPQGFILIDKPEPQIHHSNQVKLTILAAGICGTDVGIYLSKDSLKTTMLKLENDRLTLGHEFCGQIAEIGDQAKMHLAKLLFNYPHKNQILAEFINHRSIETLSQDNRLTDFLRENFVVSAEMHVTCGECYQCRLGDRHVCSRTIIKGIHQDGAFAEYMVVRAEDLILFAKDEIPVKIIAFMDAIGNATHTVQSAPVAGQNILILGCGIQGLAACAIARQLGAGKIFMTDISHEQNGLSPEQLRQTKFRQAQRLGADFCFDMATATGKKLLYDTIRQETANVGVDLVYEMSGDYSAYADAFQASRMGGTISLLGLPAGTLAVDFSKEVVFKGLKIQGIIGRRVFESWEMMRSLLTSGLTQTFLNSGLPSLILPLAQYQQGLDALIKGEAVKVVLKP